MSPREHAFTYELTPANHACIRRHIALIPVYLWLAAGWRDILLCLPLGLPGMHVQFTRDFIQFYVQGAIAHQKMLPALYDIDAWIALIPHLVPGTADAHLKFPPIYGPQISVLFSPLARFSYGTAMTIWVVVTAAGYLICGYAVWKVCPHLRGLAWTSTLLLLADPGLHFALGFSQISLLGLLCVTAAFFALRAGRMFLAGVAIGSLIYKPQLGVAAALIFLCAREWRIVLGALTGAALQLAIGCVFWGPEILAVYVRALVHLVPEIPRQFEPFRFHMHSWITFFQLLGLPPAVATSAYVVAAGATAAVALRCWQSQRPLPVRYAVVILATVLINPHMYVYDLILLMPASLLLWDWALEQGNRTVGDVIPVLRHGSLRGWSFSQSFQWLLYACYWSPMLGMAAVVLHVQVSVLLLGTLGLLLAEFLRPVSTPDRPLASAA